MSTVYGVSTDYLLGVSNKIDNFPPGGIILDPEAVEKIKRAEIFEELRDLIPQFDQVNFAVQIPSDGILISHEQFRRIVADLSPKLKSLMKQHKKK